MANESVARKEFSLLGKDSFHVKIRIIALIGLVLDIAILTLELTNVMHANTVKHVTDSITIALLVVLFARPNRTGILAFIGIAQCVINIYYGGHILGFLFYVFGLGILLKDGFFRSNRALKIALLLTVLVAVTLSQLWTFSLQRFTISVVNIALASAIVFAFLYLFHDTLRNLYREKPVLDLAKGGLTDRQLSCVRGCLEGKRIRDVAEELCVSDSVIKKEFLVVYEALGVTDYRELQYRLENSRVRFPERPEPRDPAPLGRPDQEAPVEGLKPIASV